MNFYGKVRKTFGGPLHKLFRLTVIGEENLPERGGAIVCANHTSLMDVLVLSCVLKRQVRYMAKKELFRLPLLGRLLKALGAFPVDRKGGDVGAIRRAVSIVNEGELLGVFPQGTRRPGENPRSTTVQNGVGLIAYRSHCQVIPAFLYTKKNKVRMFRPTVLIIGKPVEYGELGFRNGGSDEYREAARTVFDRVCTLGEEYETR